MKALKLPDNKKFAFTIYDDTDVSTVENLRPVYSRLQELGIYTTKSVWPVSYSGVSNYAGSQTLEDEEYRNFIKDLNTAGFEISFHNATMESSKRDKTIHALNQFNNYIGYFPKSYASHARNKENLYWGANRFTNIFLKKLYSAWKKDKDYSGELPDDIFYWGDLCKTHIKTARTFTYAEINLRKITENIFYKDPKKPFFNSCFISCDADNVEEFNNLLSLKNQNRLAEKNGFCILSTHFGKGFVDEGKLNAETDYLLTELSKKQGWFVPVIEMYDFFKSSGYINSISYSQRLWLEVTWYIHAIKRMRAKRTYDKSELQYL